MDWPALLLTFAVRRMPAERREWGAAMLAELAHLQNPLARWRFALDCARVAMFPPRKKGFLEITMNNKSNSFLATLGAASLIGLIFMLPFPVLELWLSAASRDVYRFPFALFGVLWLLPTLFIAMTATILRTVRAGNSLLAHPVSLTLRVAVLAFLVFAWTGLVYDQLPCFLGVPNCD